MSFRAGVAMTSPTPLEKVALAIHEAMRTAPYPWWHSDPAKCVISRHIAKAAINALKDPDEGTVEAMREDGRAFVLPVACRDMLNAALDHIIQAGEEA